MLNFIVSPTSGNITMFVGGKSRAIGMDHPNYTMICNALKAKDEALLLTLVDEPVILNGAARFSEDGTVTLNGQVLSSTVAKRALEFSKKGLPVEPLLRFIENCARNPSDQSVVELFEFLENKGIPITDDGCFLCYKAVRSDFMDKYKGEFYNGVGTIVKMERSQVDADRSRECSFGLHVGALPYVSNYGSGYDDIWLLVKVNPKHAVAVPRDYNAQKMRVSEYFVVQVLDKTLESQLNAPCYSSDGANTIAMSKSDVDQWDGWDDEDQAEAEDLCDDKSCDICHEQDETCEADREEEERLALLDAEIEKFMARHTRDSAVARAFRLGLIETKEIGRELGKKACCEILAMDKLNNA